MNSDDSDSDKSTASHASSVISTSTSSPSITGYMPSPWYGFPLRTTVLFLLPLLSLLGGYGTFTLSGSNGTFKSMLALIAQDEPKFPGTDEVLLKSYTGFEHIDRQLTVLVTFFAPVVDGSLTPFSGWGFGQFGAVWTLMMLESLRMGNSGRAVSWIGTVGLILQNMTYTVTVPWWLMLHILTSPVSNPFPGTHANSVLLVSSLDLKILPVSIILGFIVPSILMSLPSPESVSPPMHQIYIALWQPFPAWTIIIQMGLRRMYRFVAAKFASKGANTTLPPMGTSYLKNVKHVYRFVLTMCVITHLPVMLLTLVPSSVYKDSMPALVVRRSNRTFADIFIPYFPLPSYQVTSLAEGVTTFLQWDIYVGSIAFLLWASLLYWNAVTEKMIIDPNINLPKCRELLLGEKLQAGLLWRKLLLNIGVWCAISGPIGAVTILLWERDSIVRQKIKQGI